MHVLPALLAEIPFWKNPDYLKRAAITLLILVTAFLFWRLLRRGRARLDDLLQSKRRTVPPLHIRGLQLLTGSQIVSAVTLLSVAVFYGLVLLNVIVALLLTFSQFPATERYVNLVLGWVLTPLHDLYYGFLASLPNLITILVIAVLTRFILKAVSFLFTKADEGAINLSPWVHRDVALPTGQIVRAVIIVIALFLIAPRIPGTGSEAAKGLSVVIGLMVSFGSSSTVGNVIAGIVLTYMRPFRVGDRVQIQGTTGDVMERTFLYTKLLTPKNEEVLIPSTKALDGNITNYSAQARSGNLILYTTVTIGYDTPWQTVHQLLIDAALKTEMVAPNPQPFVLQTALDDFYIHYQVNAFTAHAEAMPRIYSELHRNIQDAFNAAGVEIMSPHYTQLRDGNQSTVQGPLKPKATRFRVAMD